MAERIYLTTTDGNIEPLQEKAFDLEDDLQALIAEHPELLDGEQIRPGDPRRWLLISREKGIAEAAGEGARWALDHLLVDQDARPTLAEVKRGWNPEIRRTVVGQVLEYAAHASVTWTAGELRETFERGASGPRQRPPGRTCPAPSNGHGARRRRILGQRCHEPGCQPPETPLHLRPDPR